MNQKKIRALRRGNEETWKDVNIRQTRICRNQNDFDFEDFLLRGHLKLGSSLFISMADFKEEYFQYRKSNGLIKIRYRNFEYLAILIAYGIVVTRNKKKDLSRWSSCRWILVGIGPAVIREYSKFFRLHDRCVVIWPGVFLGRSRAFKSQ